MSSKKAALGTALGTVLALFFNSLPGFIETETLFKRRENKAQITFINEAAAAEPEKSLELRLEQQDTFKLVFPFDKNYNPEHIKSLDDDGLIRYMNRIRTKSNVTWAKSLADLYFQPWNPLQWRNFLKKNKILGDLTPNVPLEDITKYQRSSLSYQGTCKVDPKGDCIVPKPVFYQRTPTGRLIPIDISKLGFHKRKKETAQQTERYGNGLIAFDSFKPRRNFRGRIIGFGNGDIYTIDPNNPKKRENLTKSSFNDYSPYWSKEGKIIFKSDMEGRRVGTRLYVMGEDGSNARRLKFDVSFFGVPINYYFPNRGYIISLSQKTISRIKISGSDIQEIKILSEDDCRVRHPDISLEGNILAFVCPGPENYELITMDLETTKVLSKLKRKRFDGIKLSPDGNEVLFSDHSELYNYNRTTGKIMEFDIKELPPNYKVRSYTWSPDGRKIAFFASLNAHSENRLYLMDNNGNNLELIAKVHGYRLSWQPIPSKAK